MTTFRVRGIPGSKYEGKTGETTTIRLIKGSITSKTPILVLWYGEKEKEFVPIEDLEIIGKFDIN